MNKTQLNKLMDKTQAYHEALYKKSKENSKSNKSKKNLLNFDIYIIYHLYLSIFF